MVRIGTFFTHTALSRHWRLLRVISHNHKQAKHRAAAENRAALWLATVPPPCHLLLQLLLLATPSPGPAPALVALHREMSSTNMAGGNWSEFWIGLILTASPALLPAQGNSWEYGWKGTGQLLSAAAAHPLDQPDEIISAQPQFLKQLFRLPFYWFTHAHTQP